MMNEMNEKTKAVFFKYILEKKKKKKTTTSFFFFFKWRETNYAEFIINRYIILAYVSKASNNSF